MTCAPLTRLALLLVCASVPAVVVAQGDASAPASASLEAGAPGIAVKRYQIGRELYLAGKLEQAEAEFRSAFDLFPKSAKLAFNLGRVNERLGRLADAVHFYQKYLELKPGADDRANVEKVVATLLSRLERDRPELVITTVPAGAKVYLGAAAEPAGVSPLTVRVESGSHAVRAELDGHDAAVGTVSVEKGKPAAVALTLRPKDQVPSAATVVVTSTPAGADVFLDAGKAPVGKTPLSAQVQPGSHAVRLVLADYVAATRTVQVESGRNTAIAVELKREGAAAPPTVAAAPVEPRDPGNPVLSTLGYVFMVGGLAGIGVGSWFAAKASETSNTSIDPGDREAYDAAQADLDGQNTNMWVGFGAGIVGIALGATLSVLGGGDDAPAAWSPTPSGVLVRW